MRALHRFVRFAKIDSAFFDGLAFFCQIHTHTQRHTRVHTRQSPSWRESESSAQGFPLHPHVPPCVTFAFVGLIGASLSYFCAHRFQKAFWIGRSLSSCFHIAASSSTRTALSALDLRSCHLLSTRARHLTASTFFSAPFSPLSISDSYIVAT